MVLVPERVTVKLPAVLNLTAWVVALSAWVELAVTLTAVPDAHVSVVYEARAVVPLCALTNSLPLMSPPTSRPPATLPVPLGALLKVTHELL